MKIVIHLLALYVFLETSKSFMLKAQQLSPPMNIGRIETKPSINKSADGLRGVACLSVVLHHFIAAFLPFLLHKSYPTVFEAKLTPSLFDDLCSSPMTIWFLSGNFAVAIFFVLSGYVLSSPYYREERSSLILKKRFLGRYLRLNLPVAASIVISMVLYSCRHYTNLQASEISGSQWLACYFPSKISYMRGLADMVWKSIVLGDACFNTVLWTLKTEFIGSLILLGFYIFKPKKRSLLLWIGLFLCLYWCYGKQALFFFAIMLGSLLHAVHIPKKWHLLLVITALYLGAFQFENIIYNFLPQVGPFKKSDFYITIGAILLVAPIVQGCGKKIFESGIFQFFGKISFSLYLLHFLVLCSFSCSLYCLLPKTDLALILNFFLYFSVSVLLSLVFYLYIDLPAIRFARYCSRFFINKKISVT